jgi:hypothetical protein
VGLSNGAGVFVQIGATRDGLDPYLDCAADRGMRAVLVETPAYLRRRRALSRRTFDTELPLPEPQNSAAVLALLESANVVPTLVLAGFERYIGSAYSVAQTLDVIRRPVESRPFAPLDKSGQRRAVAAAAPGVRQPWFASFPTGTTAAWPSTPPSFPCVVKPADGGGGLGVFLVDGPTQLELALAHLQTMQNYGGGMFSGVLLEEFLDGDEYSLQGIVHEGRVLVLTACVKMIGREVVPGCPGPLGFRERGHVAVPGSHTDPDLLRLTEEVVQAVGYHQGPFHIDVIRGVQGPAFLEIGFRLSGGSVVELVRRVTGARWADLAFQTYLGEGWPMLPPPADVVVGHIEAVDERELARAQELQARGDAVEVRRYPKVSPNAQPLADERAQLDSDLLRHSSASGRIVVTGDDVDDVRRRLEGFVAIRAQA